MSLLITSTDSPSENMPNVIESQHSSPSPGIRMVPQSLALICVIHAGIVIAAGISMGSARHTDHLAAYWAYTAGTSCLITLSGWHSARKGRTYIVFWRITLLFFFLANAVSGMALLRLPEELRTGVPLREVLVFIYATFTVGSVSLAAFALDWIYGNVTTPAGNPSEIQNQDTGLSRMVGTEITDVILFSSLSVRYGRARKARKAGRRSTYLVTLMSITLFSHCECITIFI
ncbi:hypothetical protein HD554DRAFT_2058819 [Boletus coccyginus]|nr:hypothetical protein HD554DRAFT_2058819 [Boletus coccyginus]